jgi:hypothetical protein
VDPRGVVRGGVGDASACSCLLHVWAEGGGGGGEGAKGRGERSSGVSDREGDVLHSSPIFLEDRD